MKINEEPVVRTASGVQVVFFSCKNFSFKKTHTHTHTHIYIYDDRKQRKREEEEEEEEESHRERSHDCRLAILLGFT